MLSEDPLDFARAAINAKLGMDSFCATEDGDEPLFAVDWALSHWEAMIFKRLRFEGTRTITGMKQTLKDIRTAVKMHIDYFEELGRKQECYQQKTLAHLDLIRLRKSGVVTEGRCDCLRWPLSEGPACEEHQLQLLDVVRERLNWQEEEALLTGGDTQALIRLHNALALLLKQPEQTLEAATIWNNPLQKKGEFDKVEQRGGMRKEFLPYFRFHGPESLWDFGLPLEPLQLEPPIQLEEETTEERPDWEKINHEEPQQLTHAEETELVGHYERLVEAAKDKLARALGV